MGVDELLDGAYQTVSFSQVSPRMLLYSTLTALFLYSCGVEATQDLDPFGVSAFYVNPRQAFHELWHFPVSCGEAGHDPPYARDPVYDDGR